MAKHGKIATVFEGLNNQRVTRYKDSFYEGIECHNYTGCPICRRCENYNRYSPECIECKVKADYHSSKDKVLMGGRGNNVGKR